MADHDSTTALTVVIAARYCPAVADDPGGANRWLSSGRPSGSDYDRRFAGLAAQGVYLHGEADLVMALGGGTVLDAGCGTGRVAVELASRGCPVVGVDLDPEMLAAARAKAPSIEWVEADLARLDLGRRFDIVVMAGNVMVFVTPGTEGAVLQAVARHLRPGGLLVAGFQLAAGGLDLATYDRLAAEAGLELRDRWATWERAPYEGGDYAVSVSTRQGPGPTG